MDFLTFMNNIVFKGKCTWILTPDVRHKPAPAACTAPTQALQGFLSQCRGDKEVGALPPLGLRGGPSSYVWETFITQVWLKLKRAKKNVSAINKRGMERCKK